MLGKLIKHEWKSTYKMGCVILLLIAGMTLIGTLGIVIPINYIGNGVETESEGMAATFMAMTMFMSIMLYMMTFMGVTYGMLIYQGVHFYKTMYSEEGYLTNTLPVTPRQLLVSKTLVSGLWYLLVEIGIILSVLVLAFSLLASLNAFSDFGREMAEIQWEIVRDSNAGLAIIHVIVSVILAVLISPFSAMLMLFGSLTVGQLSRKYKAFMGILVYMGVMFANGIIGNIVKVLFTFLSVLFSDNEAMAGFLMTFGSYDCTILVTAGIGIAFYFIAHHILTKKLNLE